MNEDSLYRDLQRHLDRMPVPFPATQSGVEMRILKQLLSPAEAKLALCLSAIAEPVATIHKRLGEGMTRETAAAALEDLAKRGLIERRESRRGPLFGKSMFVIGIYERQVNRRTAEFEREARRYFDEGFWRSAHAAPTQQLRTVPVNQSITPSREVAPYEDIREYVRTCEGPFAVANCVCRQGKDLLGEPCRQTHDRENCLMVGVGAQVMADQGSARFVERDEILRLIERADDEGLVLEPQNSRAPLFVCCCCGCCCGVLTAAKRTPRPAEYFAANYFAQIDGGKCNGCGTCAMRCQMDAVTLDGGAATIELTRCIGCGLCATTCPEHAIALLRITSPRTPPKDTSAMYARIWRERFGALDLAKAAGRNLLGLKI